MTPTKSISDEHDNSSSNQHLHVVSPLVITWNLTRISQIEESVKDDLSNVEVPSSTIQASVKNKKDLRKDKKPSASLEDPNEMAN